ncbi:carboxypeptidase-like regulatory domain-containing protein [Acidisarcina polymorpha]|uniref:carboxypeptidase-like regulatory domain-containing protein n=1 Tax=Acidisarcina polymorpha TaxID=2211140 RepID=UPI000DEFAD1A|nr:carboxypeptidase-like regulatory domain-containing protein [Acidisarcina polymorpha]
MNPHFRVRRLVSLLLLLTPFPALAASITGTVTNKTVNKPASGDKVVLIQLAGGMKESNTTTTDAHGAFTLELPDAGPHLIRVDHEKAGYFHIAPPGTQSVDVDVYDVAEKVQGVTTEANVMRLEADQQGLHVIENYFVKNASTPPRTQLSTHAYEIYLPDGAQLEGSAAMAPGGMPVSSSPVPLGDKGHYAFVFPIRPGETRFQVSYKLPYTGSYKFEQRVAIPAENFAVLMPKSMKFTPSTATPFQPVNDDVNAQTFLAKNVAPSQPLEFTVSGLGAMPREAQGQPTEGQGGPAAGAPAQAGGAEQPASPEAGSAAAASDTRPGGGLGNPIDTPDPLTKYRWWILGSLSLVLAAAAAFFLRSQPAAVAVAASSGSTASPFMPAPAGDFANASSPAPVSPMHPAAATPRAALLSVLKEELFALETERLEGTLTDPEYTELKGAFETVLRRALARETSTSA